MKTFLFAILTTLFVLNASAENSGNFSWQQQLQPDGNTRIILTVPPGHYIYADSVKFTLSAPGGGASRISAPSPAVRTTGNISEKLYTTGQWHWIFAGKIQQGSVYWRGCSDSGACFVDETPLTPAAENLSQPPSDSPIAEKFVHLETRSGYMDEAAFLKFIRREKESAPPWHSLGVFSMIILTLLGGFALNLTPCVLPMIPVNLAIIGASGGGKSGLLRGGCYGLGMACVYGILGVLAALAGVSFGTLNSEPWFNFAIAVIFILLALAMSGVFNLSFNSTLAFKIRQLPAAQTVVAFLSGGVAALLAGACVAPVVISVLIFASGAFQQGNWWALGLPFLLGIGMALPWPLAGWGIAILPKPGKFMVVIKYAFAVLIAAAAIYYAWLGIKLLHFRSDSRIAQAGSGNFAALENARQESLKRQLPILVDFRASWCKNCIAMEQKVLTSPEVQQVINQNYIFVKFNAEDPTEPATAALLKTWRVVHGFPAFAIVKPR